MRFCSESGGERRSSDERARAEGVGPESWVRQRHQWDRCQVGKLCSTIQARLKSSYEELLLCAL